jgi:capsular exopolysaccharide synthesis family protein
MEPIDYLRLARRRWRLLAACVVVAGTVAWITTPAQTSNEQIVYEATHILLRDDSGTSVPPALAQVALFVRTGEVPERVAERLGFDDNPGILADRVDVTTDDGSGSVEIRASGTSRDEAAELANAFGEETLAYFGEEAQGDLEAAIDAAADEVLTLQGEIAELDAQIEAAGGAGSATLEAQRDAKVREYALALDEQADLLDVPPPSAGYVTLDEASPERATTRDGGFETPRSRSVRVALAMALGLALGLAAMLVIERLDPRVHTRLGAAEAFQLPVVAEVPESEPNRGRGPKRIAMAIDPMSATAEAYRTLRSAILLTPVRQLGHRRGQDGTDGEAEEPHVILVTSPAPGEGKTTSVANLAAAFAETGRSVLVLSCDFRRPEVHRYFDAPQQPGLSDVLTHARRLEEVARATPINGVYLAPDGGGLRHLGDLAAEGHEMIDQARDLADIVLIDTAPMLATNDAAELIHAVDAVVVVCRSGKTTAEAGTRARVLLERLGTPVVGVALIGTTEADSSYSRYYTSTAPQPPRVKIPLRRTIRSPEIDERLAPWRVTEAGRGGQHQGGDDPE